VAQRGARIGIGEAGYVTQIDARTSIFLVPGGWSFTPESEGPSENGNSGHQAGNIP